MTLFFFIIFIVLFLLVGLFANYKSNSNNKKYLLADGSMSPMLVALSVAATKYSGYMFIGLMGYIYLHGLSAIWLLFGFLFGDVITFTMVPKKIKEVTVKRNALTFAELVANWNGDENKIVRVVIGVLTLVFLTSYAAAQLNAGGKAIESILGWNHTVGVTVGALLILAYCFYGGLKASIYTDAAQSIIMIIALVILMCVSISQSNGFSNFFNQLSDVSDSYMDLGTVRFGSVGSMMLFALGWLFNGIGTVGQPQIMVRYMALDDKKNIIKVGIYYFIYIIMFLIIAFIVGLATRLYVQQGASFDSEMALPLLSKILVPGPISGIILAGIFAASMSTADSQVLSSSAVLSEDFKILKKSKYRKQYMTAIVIFVAFIIAVINAFSVFTLVVVSWSILSATIGPLVILQALGQRLSQSTALKMMFVGFITVILWRYFGLNAHVYEGAPGMVSSLLTYFLIYIKQKILK